MAKTFGQATDTRFTSQVIEDRNQFSHEEQEEIKTLLREIKEKC